jgi:ligand-binding sensor domain-containing protein/anti-sigma regulatory factor (Ser/Thr protein kinase)
MTYIETTVIRLRIICFLSMLSLPIHAQGPAYRNYTTADGLPSTDVYGVMQDSKGFIWFATDNGVSRFDGTRFKNYSVADGLSDNTVLGIRDDSQDRLWFITFNGKLSFYQNGKIYNQTNCELLKKIKANAFTTSFFEDSKKNIWIGWNDQSLYEILASGKVKSIKRHYKSILMWQDRYGHITGLTNGGKFTVGDTGEVLNPPRLSCVFGILLSKDSLLFLNYNRNGLYTMGLAGIVKRAGNVINYKDYNISALSVDAKKNIWLCTLNGAIEYKNGIISAEYEHDYFKNYSITSVFMDKDNNLWFTSMGNGVFMIPSPDIKLFDDKSGLIENNISAVAVLNSKELMVGLLNGNVQLIENNVVKHYARPLVAAVGSIINIGENNKGITWIVSENGVFKYYDGKFITILDDTAGWNKSLFIANDGTPWLGCGQGLRKIVNDKVTVVYHYFYSNRIYALAQLHDNDFLLGTDYGLYHYKEGKLFSDSHGNSMLTYRINAMAFSSDSTLWIATNAYGLLSLKHGIVKSYTTKDHLLSDHCNNLLADSNKIYLATDNGLNVISNENNTVKITSYSVANGLVSNHINQVIKKDKNNIIIATNRGIVEFDVRKLPPSPAATPYISSLIINDSLQPLSGNYNLHYNESNIRIEYGAINFNSGGNTYYRYKLAGADANWNYTTSTSVKYSYLHLGNYKFIIATQNADGGWNPKTASFSFYIETPWWQTWWFRSIVGLSVIVIIVLVIRWRITAYKRKLDQERALSESELKALRAQINPHFIYNSLNAIQDFILQNQKEDANLYLSKFATLMRSILSHSRSSFVTLEEEIVSLRLYLELEALRFNNQFTFQFNVDEQIDSEYVRIPSMILQPYIENAVIHGLASVPDGGEIKINFSLENKFLIAEIEDNGIGRKKSSEARKQRVWRGHTSLGMTVTQERIDLMSSHQKQKINMEITDLVDNNNNACGTRVTICFPLSE